MKAKCNTTAFRPNKLQVEMVAECEMPFVPVPGQTLAVTPGGDYFEASAVFWHCERPDEFEVYIDEITEAELGVDYLKAQGWKIAGA